MKKYTFFLFFLLPLLATSQQKMDKIYDDVDIAASVIGGQGELMRWMSEMKKSIILDKKTPNSHRITFTLTIEKNGSVSNIENLYHKQHQNDVLYQIAKQKIPKWKPAIHKGRKVRSKITVVINCAGVSED
jgi:hypothetical protein